MFRLCTGGAQNLFSKIWEPLLNAAACQLSDMTYSGPPSFGVTFEPHFYLTRSARCVCTDAHFCMLQKA
jgi:hypothetical protein